MFQVVVDNPEQLLKEEGVECLTPDLAPEIIADINVSPALAKWKRELIEGARVRYELAVLRQRKITEATNRLELSHMDGLGKRICSLDSELAHRLEGMLGERWWMKPEILHEVLKDNPWLEIRSSPVRPSFLVSETLKRGKAETLKNSGQEKPRAARERATLDNVSSRGPGHGNAARGRVQTSGILEAA